MGTFEPIFTPRMKGYHPLGLEIPPERSASSLLEAVEKSLTGCNVGEMA